MSFFQILGIASCAGFLAWLFAKLEICIEGKKGWAEDLPTPIFTGQVAAYLGKFIGARPTHYHFYIFLIGFSLFNAPFLLGAPFSGELWCRNMSLYFLFIVLWDILWFIHNPAYRIERFKKEELDWHQVPWIAGMPITYHASLIFSFLFACLGFESLVSYMGIVLLLGIYLLLTILTVPYYPGLKRRTSAHWNSFSSYVINSRI